MSALKDQLHSDLTASMKARDALRTSTLRMVLAAITNAEVAGKEAEELSEVARIGFERVGCEPAHRAEVPLPGGELLHDGGVGGKGEIDHGAVIDFCG